MRRKRSMLPVESLWRLLLGNEDRMFFAQKWFAAFLTKYFSAIFMVEFNYAHNR